MIQRIQTIYLAIVGILASVFGFFSEYAITLLQNLGVQGVSSSLIAIISSLLAFATIFMFKNRKIQLSLIAINFLLVLLAAVLFVLADGFSEFYKDWTFYLLVLAFVGLFMARKGVKADESLIRSADRLR